MPTPRWQILCLNGPNLNLLGVREPDKYGQATLTDVETSLTELGERLGADVTCKQSNHEGVLIDWLHEARGSCDALIINPGGLTHTSVCLRDAVLACAIPCFEVHVTNVHAREQFRHKSLIADICAGRLMGFGALGYTLALQGAVHLLETGVKNVYDK